MPRPNDYLESFDEFDLSIESEARLATYSLDEYYSYVLSKYGLECLDFDPSDAEHGVGPKWNKAKSRISTLDEFGISERDNRIINRLSQERNSTAHNTDHNPDLDLLRDARELATEWSGWFEEAAEEYHEHQENLTAHDAMLNILRNSANNSIQSPESLDYEDLRDQQREVNESAEHILLFEEILENDEEISNLLVQNLYEAMQLEQETEKIRRGNRQRLEEEQVRENRPPSTTRCLVIEPFDEETQSVHVATHEYNLPDQHYRLYVPNFSRETQDYLRSLDVDDKISAVISHNQRGERQISQIVR